MCIDEARAKAKGGRKGRARVVRGSCEGRTLTISPLHIMWIDVRAKLDTRSRVASRVEGLNEGRARVAKMRALRWGFAVWIGSSIGSLWTQWKEFRAQTARGYWGDSDVLHAEIHEGGFGDSEMPFVTRDVAGAGGP